jgi:hypothetical protein
VLPRDIKVMLVAAFLIALGFGLVAPVLPQFATTFDVGATAAAVAPTSNVVANCGSTGATRPKPSAIRKAATSITLMSRGSGAPSARRTALNRGLPAALRGSGVMKLGILGKRSGRAFGADET